MRRILKIGGSLLLRPNLIPVLRRWMMDQTPAQNIAIVGGGEMIEAVRHLNANYRCDSAVVHWQCVQMLRTTFELLGSELRLGDSQDWHFHDDNEGVQQLLHGPHAPTNHLIAVDAFYAPGCQASLPCNWDTTTDAIAGWLSVIAKADELVLLKSCDVDDSRSLGELASDGVVDKALPGLETHLCQLRFVNFAAELQR